MTWIDWPLLVLYGISLTCALYIIAYHIPYFRTRFREGVVSAFMLAVLFFMSAYTIKMGAAVWIRVTQVLAIQTEHVEMAQRLAWLIAQVGTTTGLLILSWQTYKKRFDLWFVIDRKKRRMKGEAEEK